MVNLLITDSDNSGDQLEIYINDVGKIYIATGDLSSFHYKGVCTLDKDDAKALVKELNKLIKDLP